MSDSVRHIISRVLQGDQNAFKTLIKQHQQLVVHIVFRMVTDPRDREELAQDVFLKAHSNLSQFKFKSKLSTWIAKIAYNTCLNHLEKRRLLLYEDEWANDRHDGHSDNILALSGKDINPEEELIKADMQTFVISEIERLPLEIRTALTLFYLEDMSVGEISGIMSAPKGTIKSYLFRGRKQLKDKLLVKHNTRGLPA